MERIPNKVVPNTSIKIDKLIMAYFLLLIFSFLAIKHKTEPIIKREVMPILFDKIILEKVVISTPKPEYTLFDVSNNLLI